MIHQKDAHLKDIPGALVRTKTKKTKQKPKGEKESVIQKRVEAYCDSLGLKYIRVPDTAYSVLFASKGVPSHVKALLSVYLKGLPDITILKPVGDYNKALTMEIKKIGGKVSQGQKNWHKGLNVEICYGWNDCKKAIDKFNDDE